MSATFEKSTSVFLAGIFTMLMIIAIEINHPSETPVTLSTKLDASNDSVRCVLDSNQVLRLVGQASTLFTPASE